MRELGAGAIESGRFLVVTGPEIHDELRTRAADVEVSLAAPITEEKP